MGCMSGVCDIRQMGGQPYTTALGRLLLMGQCFVRTLACWPAFLWHAAFTGPGAAWPLRLQRFVWALAGAPFLFLLWLVHWICFFLDELLFPAYRRVVVDRPVFVIGPPRSGTTHVHRVLADHTEALTTARTWELLLAPSVLQKQLVRGVLRLDRAAGGWLRRGLACLERRLARQTERLHQSALREPEEDFYFLLPLLACPALLVVMPRWQRLWQAAWFDDGVTPAAQQRWLAFYHACIQKHLYVLGAGRRYLNKNASFNPWVGGLQQWFPEADWVICSREPARATASMLSLARSVRQQAGGAAVDAVWEERMTGLMRHHYLSLHRHFRARPVAQWLVVPMRQAQEELAGLLQRICERFDVPVTPGYRDKLEQHAADARRYVSRHRYDVAADSERDADWEAAWRFLEQAAGVCTSGGST